MPDLSDAELIARLGALVQHDNRLTAELLEHLGEMDARRLYALTAYPSAFRYCVGRLGFSEDVAYKRVAAARIAREYPLVLELVRNGKLHLSALLLVAPHLTPAGHRELLAAACCKSKREVERLVAARFPRPDVRASVRKLPERTSGGSRIADCARSATVQDGSDTATAVMGRAAAGARVASETGACAAGSELDRHLAAAEVDGDSSDWADADTHVADRSAANAHATSPPVAGRVVAPSKPADRGRVEPLSSTRYRVTFTASTEFCQKLARARELTSHAVPAGELATLFERALDLLIAHEQKRRFAVSMSRTTGATARVRSRRASTASARRSRAGTEQHEQGPGRPGESVLVTEQDPGRPSSSVHEPIGPASTRVSGGPDTPQPCGPVTAARQQAQPALRLRSRYIPADVRRVVVERDEGRCTFVDETGQRCTERRFLEFEHIEPFALGGPSTMSNVTLRCRVHNQHAARKVFGARHMEAKMRRRRAAGAVVGEAVGRRGPEDSDDERPAPRCDQARPEDHR